MKISIKILSVIFAVMLFVTVFPVSSFAVRDVDDIQADIEAQEKKLEQSLNSAKTEREKLAEYDKQNALYEEQIEAVNKELEPILKRLSELEENITTLETKIAELAKSITNLETKISEQNEKIDATYDVLADRLRATYMAGETSELEIFLCATDFQDFLTRTELIRQVAKHDNALVADLEKEVKSLEENVSELEENRTETEKSKAKLESDKAEQTEKKEVQVAKKRQLENAQAKVESNIRKANDIIEKSENDALKLERLEAELKEAEEFAAKLDEIASGGSSGDGTVNNGDVNHNYRVSKKGFISPLQDKTTYYSCPFSQHSSRGIAVDLCAPANRTYTNGKTYYTSNGAPLYAVASGTVATVSYHSAGGKYVMIDHGNGISTTYKHCRSISVSVGQKVKQGQVIAILGNTGNVSPRPTSSNPVAGSHLHFEVRVNGNRVNPEIYLPNPLV